MKRLLIIMLMIVTLFGCNGNKQPEASVYFHDEPVLSGKIHVKGYPDGDYVADLTMEEIEKYIELRESMLSEKALINDYLYGNPPCHVSITTDNKTYTDTICSYGLMATPDGYNYYDPDHEFYSYVRQLAGEKLKHEADSGLFEMMEDMENTRMDHLFYYLVPSGQDKEDLAAIFSEELAEQMMEGPFIYNETVTSGDYTTVCMSERGDYLVYVKDRKDVRMKLTGARYSIVDDHLAVEVDADTQEKGILKAKLPVISGQKQLTGAEAECELDGSGHYVITFPQNKSYRNLVHNDTYSLSRIIFSLYQDGELVMQTKAPAKQEKEIVPLEYDERLTDSMNKKISFVQSSMYPFSMGIYNVFNQKADGIYHYGAVLVLRPVYVREYDIRSIQLVNKGIDLTELNAVGRDLDIHWEKMEEYEALVYVLSFTSPTPILTPSHLEVDLGDEVIVSNDLTMFETSDYDFYQDRIDLVNGNYSDLFTYDLIDEKLGYDSVDIPHVSTVRIKGDQWSTNKLKGRTRAEIEALWGQPVRNDNVYRGFMNLDELTVTYRDDKVDKVSYLCRESGEVQGRNGNDVYVMMESGFMKIVNLYHSGMSEKEKEAFQPNVQVIVSYHGDYEDMSLELFKE
ncbi:MAG: hypothetical protein IKE78_01570 [Erysipelotrichaceae bacterium]|nr:hypothetical protein [Erysipelotrichaceae bacterium]